MGLVIDIVNSLTYGKGSGFEVLIQVDQPVSGYGHMVIASARKD